MNPAEKRDLKVLKEVAAQAIYIAPAMHITDGFHIVSALQLVTRHPDLSPAHRAEIVRIARQFQQALAEIDQRLDPILEKGWHSAYDVTKED